MSERGPSTKVHRVKDYLIDFLLLLVMFCALFLLLDWAV